MEIAKTPSLLGDAGLTAEEKKAKRAKKRRHWKTKQRTETGPRPFHTYRGFRRNSMFGRKPVGNTTPEGRWT